VCELAYVVGVDLLYDVLHLPAVEQAFLLQGLLQLLRRDVPARIGISGFSGQGMI
jgi:hypothetical protein